MNSFDLQLKPDESNLPNLGHGQRCPGRCLINSGLWRVGERRGGWLEGVKKALICKVYHFLLYKCFHYGYQPDFTQVELRKEVRDWLLLS